MEIMLVIKTHSLNPEIEEPTENERHEEPEFQNLSVNPLVVMPISK